jgi:molecular chaperone DnaJ
MARRNFYGVLGVEPTESSAGIRHAFRELALRYHPDRAGADNTRFFQEIVEAYQVLSDPRQRASYDEGLGHAGETELSRRPPVTPAIPPEPEPLVPEPISLFRDFVVTRPSLDEVFQRFFRSFTEPWLPKSQRIEPLELELILSSDEAARGGTVTLGVPVFYPCRVCHGSRWVESYRCLACDGSGMVQEEENVQLYLPPVVRDGTVFRIPLRGLGIHNMYLQVLVRVGEPRY